MNENYFLSLQKTDLTCHGEEFKVIFQRQFSKHKRSLGVREYQQTKSVKHDKMLRSIWIILVCENAKISFSLR